ncbi:thiamine phosphate synthase [Thermoactinomyces sp. DSM 45892]|uniref:thiamine phosphate synthase n=1 Tax=Thermoactinomyces sp. DSM 45892 TaxID=1882753 RepID=UPI000894C61B|nr:thiamine phosphate synthase [Thermoactinomyces sp. DSM 45892]SDY59493.1 thiamine-phosphate diphosphorylase [Thermoactinomyces sp. DSM 45892]
MAALAHDLRLYLVTDEYPDLLSRVEKAIQGGITCVQLRRKKITDDQFIEEALQVRQLCRLYQIPFAINDRVEIARAVNADWLHIGQEDKGILFARTIVGSRTKIGVSVHSVEEALEAESSGADYVGVGALFPTSSKPDTIPLPLDTLRSIRKAIGIPIVGIGGITEENIKRVPPDAVDGFAIISSILSAPDPKSAAVRMREAVETVLNYQQI